MLGRYNTGMEKTPNTSPAIAVSACLLGRPCRYDGSSKPSDAVMQLGRCYKLVPICPEVTGGLPVPHSPCEIVAGSRPVRVMDANGDDVTQAFHLGASRCLEQFEMPIAGWPCSNRKALRAEAGRCTTEASRARLCRGGALPRSCSATRASRCSMNRRSIGWMWRSVLRDFKAAGPPGPAQPQSS